MFAGRSLFFQTCFQKKKKTMRMAVPRVCPCFRRPLPFAFVRVFLKHQTSQFSSFFFFLIFEFFLFFQLFSFFLPRPSGSPPQRPLLEASSSMAVVQTSPSEHVSHLFVPCSRLRLSSQPCPRSCAYLLLITRVVACLNVKSKTKHMPVRTRILSLKTEAQPPPHLTTRPRVRVN